MHNQILATIGNVQFTECGYFRGARFVLYREGATITVNGTRYKAHRAVAFAQCDKWHRSHFDLMDAHHVHGRGEQGTPFKWGDIQPLTHAQHIKLHRAAA